MIFKLKQKVIYWFISLVLVCTLVPSTLFSQNNNKDASKSVENKSELELMDDADLDVLKESDQDSPKLEQAKKEDLEKNRQTNDLKLSTQEEVDELDSLKEDVGETYFPEKKIIQQETPKETKEAKKEESKNENPVKIVNDEKSEGKENKDINDKVKIFDTGDAEKELIKISKFLENKIPEKEWEEIAKSSRQEKYTIVEGDWLWKISKKLFGSGFYYAKIWSLNPYIKNPHEIEPGMVLTFDTGTETSVPQVSVDGYGINSKNDGIATDEISEQAKNQPKLSGFDQFGEDVKPAWIDERKKLVSQGVYFQNANEYTYQDLEKKVEGALNSEYEKYSPVETDIDIEKKEIRKNYDDSGFDKKSIAFHFKYKEGFFLNTFVTTNIVQDFGEIDSAPTDTIFIAKHSHVYIKFDEALKVVPGDKFSIYSAEGKVDHLNSDRAGYRYTIKGEVRVLGKVGHLWECEITEATGVIQRKDRITSHTPKIEKIFQTFNPRNIEAAIVAGFVVKQSLVSFGDVVYLDRGRADGVELGNVFEVYSFEDRQTEKRITKNPTYKIGELTVITLTDNFATALVTNSTSEIKIGSVALSKTQASAARKAKIKDQKIMKDMSTMDNKVLEDLDVELNLDNVSEDLLKRADQVKLNEDELEELEKAEREKSKMKQENDDLKQLEKIESDIESAENILNSEKMDEDKHLDQEDLNILEKSMKGVHRDGFESLDEIEKDLGRKFMDENLNAKDNPYGLTEFDLEEIDELLNTDTK